MMMVGFKRDVLPIDRYRDSDLRYYRRFVFSTICGRFTADEFVAGAGREEHLLAVEDSLENCEGNILFNDFCENWISKYIHIHIVYF